MKPNRQERLDARWRARNAGQERQRSKKWPEPKPKWDNVATRRRRAEKTASAKKAKRLELSKNEEKRRKRRALEDLGANLRVLLSGDPAFFR